jgi:hypothetical protein
MDLHYAIDSEPATPEYVLAVLQDQHRQACQFDPECEADIAITFETTVADWRTACDLLPWRPLGRAENKLWRINRSDNEWQAVLEPAHERRLFEVCQLIAGHARRPRISPYTVFGRDCDAAGAFLSVRSMLREAGANAEDIAPSTPLANYTRRYCSLFLGPISRLAPGALPPVRYRHLAYDAATWMMVLAVLLWPVVFWIGIPLLTAATAVLFAIGYAFSWLVAAGATLPASVEFGSLKTFRDLAVVVSDSSRQRSLPASHTS